MNLIGTITTNIKTFGEGQYAIRFKINDNPVMFEYEYCYSIAPVEFVDMYLDGAYYVYSSYTDIVQVILDYIGHEKSYFKSAKVLNWCQ